LGFFVYHLPMRILILSLISAGLSLAIEIEIRFPLLEKQLSQQLFTQDGKRYVKGNPKSHCNFAYLAEPHFTSRQGKLLIEAKFTGKSSMDLFGKCVGFGDSFVFEILSGLTTKDGTLVLDKPEVQIIKKDSFYSRQVLKSLKSSIGDAIRYPIRDEVRKLLANGSASAPYKVTIPKLEIRGIQILENSLLLDVDTRFLVE
jgi:hypothetical protein